MEGRTNKTDFIDPSFFNGGPEKRLRHGYFMPNFGKTLRPVLSASYKVSILVSSAEFRRSFDKIPRSMGLRKDELVRAGCFLKDDGLEPNSVGGWIGILTLPCTFWTYIKVSRDSQISTSYMLSKVL